MKSVSSSSVECIQVLISNLILLPDEISQTTADLFMKINMRLREFFDKDRAFGGIGVIIMGDFYQVILHSCMHNCY